MQPNDQIQYLTPAGPRTGTYLSTGRDGVHSVVSAGGVLCGVADERVVKDVTEMTELMPYYTEPGIDIHHGSSLDVLPGLPDCFVNCCVTSPPYFGLRDYGVEGQIGLESTPDEFVAKLVSVFREVRRVLTDDGTLWLNLGDSYANDGKWGGSSGGKHVTALHGNSGIGRGKKDTGLKPKDLIGIPWRVAFALQADGWYLRADNVWAKPNGMPESVSDRTTRSHEYVFHLSKSARYFHDGEAVRTAPKESTETRLRQNVENQIGSICANGGAKTNGNMKAVGGPRQSDKQRGHSSPPRRTCTRRASRSPTGWNRSRFRRHRRLRRRKSTLRFFVPPSPSPTEKSHDRIHRNRKTRLRVLRPTHRIRPALPRRLPRPRLRPDLSVHPLRCARRLPPRITEPAGRRGESGTSHRSHGCSCRV